VLRHVALLTWIPGTPPATVAAIEAALAGLPDRIPEIRAFSVGSDAGIAADAPPGSANADLAVVADFDDVDGWRAYQDHPEHRRVLAELIRPNLAVRTAVQFHV
jgi:Stress responsive A/B Barrel Domain